MQSLHTGDVSSPVNPVYAEKARESGLSGVLRNDVEVSGAELHGHSAAYARFARSGYQRAGHALPDKRGIDLHRYSSGAVSRDKCCHRHYLEKVCMPRICI